MRKDATKKTALRRFSGLFTILIMLVVFIVTYGVMEQISKAYLNHQFGKFEFDLNVQGNGSMVESSYQVWETPKNYSSWSGETRYNNHGFRRFEDTSIEKSEKTIRVIIFGGSTAFGSQPNGIYVGLSGQGELNNRDTISGWMERILNEKYPERKFEVINAATNWARLHQQLIHYLRKIRSFSPDVVISIDGANDSTGKMGDSINTWELTQIGYEREVLQRLKYKLRPLFRRSYTLYLLAMLRSHSSKVVEADEKLIAKYINVSTPNNYDQQLREFYAKNKDWLESLVAEYFQTMGYFHEVLKLDEVHHFFALQPLSRLDTAKTFTKREKAIRGYQRTQFPKNVHQDLFFRRLAEEGHRLRIKKEIPFLNMHNVFRDTKEQAYTDYCHFTPAGNRAYAQALVSEMESRFPDLFDE
jgi:hypothetical protein